MNRREAIAALVATPAIARIERAAVAPDEVLVIESDQRLSDAMRAHLRRQVEAIWPGHKVLVLDQGLHVRVGPRTR